MDDDSYSRFDGAGTRAVESPWQGATFLPDLPRLEAMMSRCVTPDATWVGQTAGAIGKGLDLWIADELRRAGYEPDAVWPRADRPRVLPASSGRLLRRLPKSIRTASGERMLTAPFAEKVRELAGQSTMAVQGEFFPKQVDVLVADWDRGVELMVSTKSMTGSYGNNITNRWEEFVGDLRNIRGRFPLATLGAFYLSDIGLVGEKDNFARLQEMLRRLRNKTESGAAYDATGLVLANASGAGKAELRMDQVPDDLRPGRFFEDLIRTAFERLPNSERAAARRMYGTKELPTIEVTGIPDEIASN